MANFLSWLYGVASYVYLWFGSAFWSLYAGASNAYTWAVTQAQAALTTAKNYAYGLLQGIQADLKGWQDWTRYQLDQLRLSLTQAAGFTYSQILGFIQTQLGPVLAAIQAARDYAAGLVGAISTSVTALARQLISDAIGAINSGLSWINSIRNYLQTLTSTLNLAVLPNLIQLATTWYASLTGFLSDPVGWVLDVLSADLVAALSWLVAMGLGAVQSDLPHSPPWKK